MQHCDSVLVSLSILAILSKHIVRCSVSSHSCRRQRKTEILLKTGFGVASRAGMSAGSVVDEVPKCLVLRMVCIVRKLEYLEDMS